MIFRLSSYGNLKLDIINANFFQEKESYVIIVTKSEFFSSKTDIDLSLSTTRAHLGNLDSKDMNKSLIFSHSKPRNISTSA